MTNKKFSSENKDDHLLLLPGQHIMIKLTSVSKPYTPIVWNEKSMKLLVKIYPNGTASNCFKELKIGNDLFVRGPYGEFQYKQNRYSLNHSY